MKLVLGPRGSGKTTKLLHQCAENGYVMVVMNDHARRNLLQHARQVGIEILRPATYDELLRGDILRGRKVQGIMIDDLELFLTGLMPRLPVIGVSATMDVELLHFPLDRTLLDNLNIPYFQDGDDV